MNERGSIFIETLIASAILALILGAMFQILQDSAHRAARVAGQREAMAIAQSRLSEYPLNQPTATMTRNGVEGQYRWHVEVRDDDPGVPAGLARVLVTVARAGDRMTLTRIATLRPGARP